ncbi:MAG: phage capsid protein [Nitrospira sp.]
MDQLEQSLGEIKSGIKGIVSEQAVQKSEIKALQDYHRSKFGPSDKTARALAMTNESSHGFSLGKIIKSIVETREGKRDAWERNGATFEQKILEEATRKALDTGTAGSGGGYIVPQEYVADVIQMLYAQSCVVRAGATVLEGLKGSPVKLPKQTGSGTVYWIGQNATITASDASFGEVQMTPKTMAMRTQFSNLLNLTSNPAAEQLIRQDFAKTAALELDRVALRGSGSSNQPLGVANAVGIGAYAIGTNGGNWSLDHTYGIHAVVEDANAAGGKLALVTHPKGLRKMKRERIAQFSGDTGGMYSLTPSLLTDEALSKAIGLQCLTTTQLPVNLVKGSSSDCTEVYFGNWSDLMIGIWGDMEILATNVGGNAWTQNAIEVRLILNVDIALRHAESFVLCNDARTT